ncbi:autophagy protein Apg5-domain-containing protein, partial [Zopfochytrium polystomum]
MSETLSAPNSISINPTQTQLSQPVMTTWVDVKTTRLVWNGSLPLAISLHPLDGEALERAASTPPGSPSTYQRRLTRRRDPLLLVAPRCGYLTFLTSKVQKHLLEGNPVAEKVFQSSELWYDWKGIPLKWHYPIGLLYDILASGSQQTHQMSLPWELTVHVTSFPSDKLFRTLSPISGADPPRDFYMAQLKESDFIRNGSTKKVMSLSKADQSGMWEALEAGDHDKFWEVNSRLLGLSTAADPLDGATVGPNAPRDVLGGTAMPRFVPFRIYQGDKPVIQDLVSPKDSKGEDLTVFDLLRRLMPDVLSNINLVEPASIQVKGEPLSPAPDGDSSLSVILHGIAVPLSTPILWLALNFIYPDNFLHIVLQAASAVGRGYLLRWRHGLLELRLTPDRATYC